MSSFVVLREYIPSDAIAVSELLRNAYLSNVFHSWCIAVMKEVMLSVISFNSFLKVAFVDYVSIDCDVFCDTIYFRWNSVVLLCNIHSFSFNCYVRKHL